MTNRSTFELVEHRARQLVCC